MLKFPINPQFIWVGGALDDHTRLLARHVPAHQHYVQWFEVARLRRLLQSYPAQQIVLIGHSYGASTAAKLVAKGNAVNVLITLDPVGWQPVAMHNISRHCQHWLNFRAADTKPNFANWVARAGGWWQHAPQPFAHQHIDIPADHALVVSKALAQLPKFAATDNSKQSAELSRSRA